MSYILDALKRADAERGRGAVPGLHTRQMTSPALADSPRAGQRAGLAALALVALGGVAAGVWFWQKPASPAQLAALEPAGAQVAAPAPPLAQPPILAPVPALKPAVVPAAQKNVLKPKPAPVVDVLAPPPKPRPDPVPVAKVSSAPAAPVVIPLLSELPDTIRRQLPPLLINGSVYSNNPGQRLLLVNNLVLPQGAQAAPEVTLEEIRPKSSVFSFRGSRFQLAH